MTRAMDAIGECREDMRTTGQKPSSVERAGGEPENTVHLSKRVNSEWLGRVTWQDVLCLEESKYSEWQS